MALRKASHLEEPTQSPSPPSTIDSKLPLREIPGDYGLPFISPIKDRLDYFYNQGREVFFKTRVQRHGSTVFKVNMPPGPFIASDPRVIALLDSSSFPVLFDNDLVEKKDLFTGTFMPSTDLSGGFRTLSYLDVREPAHADLKKMMFHLLSARKSSIIPEFSRTFRQLFGQMESEIGRSGKADFNKANDQAAFNFLNRALLGKDPLESKLGPDGPDIVAKWVLIQLCPILTLGLPRLLEELILRSFRLPSFLVKNKYERLASFFRDSSGWILDEAERNGIAREEAVHNLVYTICFNAYGGLKIVFPSLVKWVGRAGASLHARLADEVRSAVRANEGKLTMRAMEEMPLVKSVVYEVLRIEPPVTLQYGRARRDFLVESHDACFKIQAGEMLVGYQPMAARDGRVMERAEEFVGEGFVGAEGERLLKYVLWSNGRETETPTVGDKQCAGKDFVVLVMRIMVVELFLRYDGFDVECGSSPLGSSVKFTSLKKASF